MKKDFNKALFFIIDILHKEKINYFVFGSSSLKIRGLTKIVKDIDIVISYKDLKKLDKAISKYKNITFNTKDHNYRIGGLLNFNVFGTEIEVMAFKSNSEDKLALSVLKDPKLRETVVYKKKKVILVKLGILLKMYRYIYLLRGERKHLKRIELLEKLTINYDI
ncbi:MAG: hypothetical protein WCF78_02075 [archaeon]